MTCLQCTSHFTILLVCQICISCWYPTFSHCHDTWFMSTEISIGPISAIIVSLFAHCVITIQPLLTSHAASIEQPLTALDYHCQLLSHYWTIIRGHSDYENIPWVPPWCVPDAEFFVDPEQVAYTWAVWVREYESLCEPARAQKQLFLLK